MTEAKRLRRKLFLFQSVVLALLCIVVSIGVAFPLYKHLTNKVQEGYANEASIKASAVSQWILRAEDLARQITSRSQIREELKKYNQGSISLKELQNFTRPKLGDALLLSEEIVGITRCDARGNVVVSLKASPPLTAINSAGPKQNEVILGDPFESEGEPRVWLKAPILGRSGEFVGTDIIVVNTERLLDIVGGSSSTPEKQAQSSNFLVYPQGNHFQLVSGEAYQSTPSNMEYVRNLLATARQVMRDNRLTTFQFEKSYCLATPVTGSNWVIVTCLDEKQLYSQVFRDLASAFAIAIVLYAICLLGYWMLLHPLAKRILLKQEELESEIAAKTLFLKNELDARVKAENALKESEERYRLVVENANESIVIVQDGRAIFFNPKTLELTGYTAEEYKSISISDIVHPDDLAMTMARHENRMMGKIEDESYQYRIITKSGEIKWLKINPTKIIWEGKPASLGLAEDITERIKMEIEREELIASLQAALKEIKELRGFLPICANCKKIRDDEGYWQQVEEYIQDRTNAQFSHSICPDCMRKLYPEYCDK